MPIFKSTPYFHIGGDEARFTSVMQDPNVINYMKSNDLGNTDVHELYRHFLVRVNEMVKKYGKQTCIWEGFAREGEVEIPKDTIVFEFESLYHLPNELIDDGYTVVNTSWKPLYVVNEKKWEPKTIYDCNMSAIWELVVKVARYRQPHSIGRNPFDHRRSNVYLGAASRSRI